MGIEILIDKFHLTDSKIDEFKRTAFRFIPAPSNAVGSLKNINPQWVVGTVNEAFNSGSLYEFYDTFHKTNLLDDRIFDDAIKKPNTGEYPCIYKIEGEYYLDQGRHRIILSRLKGLKSIKVWLKQ